MTSVLGSLRAFAQELRDHTPQRRPARRPVAAAESPFVKYLMAALLPAGLLWLVLVSLLRTLFG